MTQVSADLGPIAPVSSTPGPVYIGHAGWSYPAWRNGAWFPKGLKHSEEMRYYASKVPTTELNTTFYHLPSEANFVEWRESVHANFKFSVKMSQYLTHDHLLDPDEMERSFPLFAERCRLLKNKLGPILVQLPPNFACDMDKLRALERLLPSDLQFAFEFRHESWHCEAVYAVLRARGWALVLVSHPKLPFLHVLTAPFVYVRMHGVRELHHDLYTDAELAVWAARVAAWSASGRAVYVYFQSDYQGWGMHNATTLQAMCAARGARVIPQPQSALMRMFGAPTRAASPPAAPPPSEADASIAAAAARTTAAPAAITADVDVASTPGPTVAAAAGDRDEGPDAGPADSVAGKRTRSASPPARSAPAVGVAASARRAAGKGVGGDEGSGGAAAKRSKGGILSFLKG